MNRATECRIAPLALVLSATAVSCAALAPPPSPATFDAERAYEAFIVDHDLARLSAFVAAAGEDRLDALGWLRFAELLDSQGVAAAATGACLRACTLDPNLTRATYLMARTCYATFLDRRGGELSDRVRLDSGIEPSTRETCDALTDGDWESTLELARAGLRASVGRTEEVTYRCYEVHALAALGRLDELLRANRILQFQIAATPALSPAVTRERHNATDRAVAESCGIDRALAHQLTINLSEAMDRFIAETPLAK